MEYPTGLWAQCGQINCRAGRARPNQPKRESQFKATSVPMSATFGRRQNQLAAEDGASMPRFRENSIHGTMGPMVWNTVSRSSSARDSSVIGASAPPARKSQYAGCAGLHIAP
jgi:hypothetical protein